MREFRLHYTIAQLRRKKRCVSCIIIRTSSRMQREMDSKYMIGFQITSEISKFFTIHGHYICFTRFILPSKNFNNYQENHLRLYKSTFFL